VNTLFTALALLTIVPIRRTLDFNARAFSFFPFIGALIGLVLTAAFLALRLFLPPLVPAALIVALWALLTGALHLDGVSDSFDGLLAATTRERRLEILKDVHIGAFGVTGLALVLLLKFGALYDLNPIALFLAPVLARWAMVYAAAFPLARKQGMAALFANGLSRRELLLSTLFALVCTVPFGWWSVGAWLMTVLVATALARFALARLGGLTGDIYGLICECVEVSILILGTVILK
jgi:adenosylcobinamide-GDP ribazoletransferase